MIIPIDIRALATTMKIFISRIKTASNPLVLSEPKAAIKSGNNTMLLSFF